MIIIMPTWKVIVRIKLMCLKGLEQLWLIVSAKYIVVVFSCMLVGISC